MAPNEQNGQLTNPSIPALVSSEHKGKCRLKFVSCADFVELSECIFIHAPAYFGVCNRRLTVHRAGDTFEDPSVISVIKMIPKPPFSNQRPDLISDASSTNGMTPVFVGACDRELSLIVATQTTIRKAMAAQPFDL